MSKPVSTRTPARKTAPGGAAFIAKFAAGLPNAPGVYRMIDARGSVLYVGKAKNLKKRVQSYTRMMSHPNRIARMVLATADMEVVTTATETEALLLEANLIKRLKPRYNVILRDDKSFPYILLARDHPTARILKHRGARNRKGEYFGPFASAGAVNRTLNALQRAFLLRSCSDSVFSNRVRPCLLYQIKRCSAPCTGEITPQAYEGLIDEALRFLTGRSQSVRQDLLALMEQASSQQDYERAAVYRDRIAALSHVQSHQGINPQTLKEADVFALWRQANQTCVQVFFFRAGQNWGNRAYFPRADQSYDEAGVLETFLAQFYDNKPPPRMILLSHDIRQPALLSEALATRAGHTVRLAVPKRGEKRKLVGHALANAREALARRMAQSASQRKLLDAVAEAFGLDQSPERIEVYDNSHISGANPLGAMIVAGAEGLLKNQYRKFNIKSCNMEAGDDYAMMREVLTRRFTRLLREEGGAGAKPKGGESGTWPDLIVIDGGAGQLGVAIAVMSDLGVGHVRVVAMAKGPERNAGRERFFMPGVEPFMLEPRDPVLYYLQRLRDEAHRFAIGSHRAQRKKAMTGSPLDEISGIGPGRKRALLRHFGSAREVARAGLSDLEAVAGVSTAMAARIYGHFHDQAD